MGDEIDYRTLVLRRRHLRRLFEACGCCMDTNQRSIASTPIRIPNRQISHLPPLWLNQSPSSMASRKHSNRESTQSQSSPTVQCSSEQSTAKARSKRSMVFSRISTDSLLSLLLSTFTTSLVLRTKRLIF